MSAAATASPADFAKTQPLGFDAPAASAAASTAGLTATSISGPLPITLSPQRRDGAVLFTEVRGLVSMSGALEPEQVLSLTNDFCNYVAEAVAAAGGEAIGLHHDAMLSVFCRGSATNSAQRAIRAAQQIQGGFAATAERWRQSCGLRSALSQGMHLGEITLGTAGPRGAERRLALGDSVTVGHYILRRARAGEIVMSDSVMGALSVDNLNLDAEPLPQLEIARRQPIRIYGVLVEERLDFT